MSKQFALSLFIFRRDLRLEDNNGLINALERSTYVIPCFIFDPEQVTQKNRFKSDKAIQFMLESLYDLAVQLRHYKASLYLFYGTPNYIISNLLNQLPIEALFFNRDYTPYSKQRDTKLAALGRKAGIDVIIHNDILLTEPETISTQAGSPYKIFTPFYKKAIEQQVPVPVKNSYTNYYQKAITGNISFDEVKKKLLGTLNQQTLYTPGGRTAARAIFQQLHKFMHYKKTRDYPAIDTTLLSGHNKFGTVSIREVYHAISTVLGRHHLLIKQLYWRDFFTHITFHYPRVLGSAFQEKYNQLPWSTDTEKFDRWCNGTTGFPIVDAGMRQLNQTGFMHNRVRMIVGSFLVKDLHINWLWGEQYFAQHLLDYDPAVNNGNWQWIASTGSDMQPYFRIFNPWLQQKKYDPQAEYIKTWVPELVSVPIAVIHTWGKKQRADTSYPLPMVDHRQEAAQTKKIFKQIS